MRSSFLALFAGALSFSADSVISSFFLMIPAAQFTESVLAKTGRTTMLYEDRYKRGIAEGAGHTFVLTEMAEPDGGGLDTVIAGTSVFDWFTAHIDGTEGWVDLVDEGL